MPRVERSPPSTPAHTSESEAAPCDDRITEGVTKRQKRKKDSPPSSSGKPRDDIMNMLNNWKSGQDKDIKNLCSSMADISTQMSKMTQSHDEIMKLVDFISKQYDDMKLKVESLEKERNLQKEHIVSLEARVEDLQRQQKSSQIEIRNVQTAKLKSKEELCAFTEKCCEALEVPIKSSDIRDIYQFNDKKGNSTIVTEFHSVLTKDKIVDAARTYNRRSATEKFNSSKIGYNSPSFPIYISESLTPKTKRMLFLARGVANDSGYKFCWTVRGRIFLRKDVGLPAIEIRSESQLQALREKTK